jgi:signal transduction histidine kinase
MEAYLGAHQVPKRADHEIERAGQRAWAALAIVSTWACFVLVGEPSTPLRLSLIAFCCVYAVASFAYRTFVRAHPDGGVAIQYLFLLMDPVALVLVLFEDPQHFAFLNPFLLVVIVRCGIRYGTRTMWLAWGIACAAASMLLPLNPYWHRETELAMSFALTLMFVPVFFPTLIRRVHQVRAIEEERARLKAMQEGINARSAFLAKVSHELRSPLQSIISALDVFEMRHGPGIPSDDELIGRMRRSSMLLNTHLRDLLTLARGQAGSLELHAEPLEITSLLEGVSLAAQEAASEKGLRVELQYPPDPVFVVADGARIDQVLTNLVANSIRYTEHGWIRIKLHQYDADHNCLRITVADSGSGMPAERLQTLFAADRFLLSSDRKGEGFGIGLAVVRTLVDRLGGKISVDSDVGRGTTFEIEVPAERIDPGEADPASDRTIGGC